MNAEEFNKLDLFAAGEECRFDLEEAVNKYGLDYVAFKKSIMLDLSRGSDFHLACLLRVPDAGWNKHYDPNEPNGPFANKFRLLVTWRIQHLCQERNTPIGMEGTVPLSSRGEKMLMELANKAVYLPRWWSNLYMHAERGLRGLLRHRPECKDELQALGEFFETLNGILETKPAQHAYQIGGQK